MNTSIRKIVVTGVCGTVGRQVFSHLFADERYVDAELVGIDSNETELFFLEQEYIAHSRAHFFLADVRDRDSLVRLFDQVDLVFHLAALKHVVMCERRPTEAIQTNILGVQNVISTAIDRQVKNVIFTSSDKAVNPTSVMGASKQMGERLITAANSQSEQTRFSSTRFGNVLGSRGSVIPIFTKQIAMGGPVTLTDDAMTRFIMSVDEAAKLVIESSTFAKGGEVLITKMPVIKIRDLAEVMIEVLAEAFNQSSEKIQVSCIGTKPGEKLYEELMSEEETRRTVELDEYFSVLPAYSGMYSSVSYEYRNLKSEAVDKPYHSSEETALDHEQIRRFLLENKVIDFEKNSIASRYWPGDKEEG